MKKVVFILILAFLLAPAAYCADSGTWGKGVSWTLEDGLLTVSGGGEMDDGCPLTSAQRDSVKSAVIGEGIVSVGERCFSGFKNLETVKLPDSLIVIDEAAFKRCESLTTVIIPSSVRLVCNHAFRECPRLNELWFMGDNPFSGEFYRINCIFASVTALIHYPNGYENWKGVENKQFTNAKLIWSNFTVGDITGEFADEADSILTEEDLYAAAQLVITGCPPEAKLRKCDLTGDGQLTGIDLIMLAQRFIYN